MQYDGPLPGIILFKNEMEKDEYSKAKIAF